MSKHFDFLGKLRLRAIVQRDISIEDQADRIYLLSIALKCSDIGHGGKETPLHTRWTYLVLEEFFLQGDEERRAGMPISMYCDRNTTNIPKSQIGFL
jgi:hypothetical protein